MKNEAEEGPRGFAVVLRQIADGEAEAEASEKLHEMIRKCEEIASMTNGSASGELTLKIRAKVDDRGTAAIGYEVTVKLPKMKRTTATMWVTKGGNLTPEMPRQQKLPLQEVPIARQADVGSIAAESRNV